MRIMISCWNPERTEGYRKRYMGKEKYPYYNLKKSGQRVTGPRADAFLGSYETKVAIPMSMADFEKDRIMSIINYFM